MKDPGSHLQTDSARSLWLIRLAGWCAYASAVVSVFGIVFLVVFFTLGGVFGPLNDIAVIVQYVLMLPIASALHQLLKPYGRGLSTLGTLIGTVGMLGVVVLQVLLVTGLLPFSRQILMVIPAFLVVLAWFVVTAILARRRDLRPNSLLLAALAGLYIGYPFWGCALGRSLLSWWRDSPRSAG